MAYSSLRQCVLDLEKHNMLLRITDEVDPYLEMAAIQRRVYAAGGPAILFERVKGSRFPAVSNLFGTLERSKFIFRDTLAGVQALVAAKGDPAKVLKDPVNLFRIPWTGIHAMPLPAIFNKPVLYGECKISDIPQIQCWPDDGGAFVTLPQVFSEDIDKPGLLGSNLGMYRIQLGGNEYIRDKEIGLHYQIHRGIGVHQYKADKAGEEFKVCIFVGGPPAHTLAAVMPLPEGLPEVAFAGGLAGRNFRYVRKDGFTLSADADFVICGTVSKGAVKPEGPFGDHLGYYSLTHDFPVLKVHKVFHRKNAIWPFTVVGRPPQEDTSFGALIHEIVGDVISTELPGVKEVHAVDESGVHPLLLAIGSERYTPYNPDREPAELLTIANHILGTGQLSLAKYLIIAAQEDAPNLHTHDMETFFDHVLRRVRWERDLHFQTQTTMDTLDYSSRGLNKGSKLVIAATGEALRDLDSEVPSDLSLTDGFSDPRVIIPGLMSIRGPEFKDENQGRESAESLARALESSVDALKGFPMIILCDDSEFTARNFANFLWVTFTRSNPADDVYGVRSFARNKHWGCEGPLIIDARIKPHHAPPLLEDPEVEKRVDAMGAKGGALYGII